jgi:uncharacterized Fe-S radical SAM superfamily protein PflX
MSKTPVFMRAEKPRRSLQCGFQGLLVNKNSAFSTLFFAICRFLAVFCQFYLVLPMFFPRNSQLRHLGRPFCFCFDEGLPDELA